MKSIARGQTVGESVGLSCPSITFCAAVDVLDILTTTDANAPVSSWTGAEDLTIPGFSAVSCATRSMCVAVAGQGDIATSTDPTGNAGAWRVADVDGNLGTLDGISCPTVSFCAAIDSAGNVLTSIDPTHGPSPWHITKIETPTPEDPLTAISCASRSLCVAVTGNPPTSTVAYALISTNPAGGAQTWRRIALPISFASSISCPTRSLCAVAGNRLLISTNPAGRRRTWHSVAALTAADPGNPQVSCPSRSFCAALAPGTLLLSHHPALGRRAWTSTRATGVAGSYHGQTLNALSCASATLCAAAFQLVTDSGALTISPHPVNRTTTWASTPTPHTATGVSCPAPTECIAVDSAGDVIVGLSARPQPLESSPLISTSEFPLIACRP